MFELLQTTGKVNNTNKTNIDIAIVLNYAHVFPPDKLKAFVVETCGNMPSIILFDFDSEVKHLHQDKYYEKDDYKIIKFDCSNERELFIWEE